MPTYIKKSIYDLKPHTINNEIYGDEDVSSLAEEIQKSGTVHTLTINDNNIIISGHRRWKTCKKLVSEGDERFKTVNCEVVSFENELEEQRQLVLYNQYREKTAYQLAQEAEKLLDIEKKLAAQRQKEGKKIDLIPKTGQGSVKGRSGDIVSEKLNMKSGHEVDRAVKSVKKIRELTEQGRTKDAKLIKDAMNSSYNYAETLSKYIDDLSEDDKQKIANGEKASKFIKKYKENADKDKSETPKNNAISLDDIQNDNIQELKDLFPIDLLKQVANMIDIDLINSVSKEMARRYKIYREITQDDLRQDTPENMYFKKTYDFLIYTWRGVKYLNETINKYDADNKP